MTKLLPILLLTLAVLLGSAGANASEHCVGSPVMSHGGRLVSVRMAKPTTVREVRRERDARADEVPLSTMVDPYLHYGLMERISLCIVFLKDDGDALVEVQPPGTVLRAMLEQSHKRAPALVGIIEHPVYVDLAAALLRCFTIITAGPQ